MKKEYLVPEAKMIALRAEEILGPSGDFILDPKGQNSPSAPAEDFGSVDIF